VESIMLLICRSVSDMQMLCRYWCYSVRILAASDHAAYMLAPACPGLAHGVTG